MTSALPPAVGQAPSVLHLTLVPRGPAGGASAAHPPGAFFLEPTTVFSEERCRAR